MERGVEGWNINVVRAMFSRQSQANIGKHFSAVDRALDREMAKHGVPDRESIIRLKLYTFATIRVENSKFDPGDEQISHFNTAFHLSRPQGLPSNLNELINTSNELLSAYHLDRPFALYDDSARSKSHLGNIEEGMGQTYRGRGFIQITGRNNYIRYSHLAHAPEIVSHPERAHNPQVAARILAAYIVTNRHAILRALGKPDFRAARAVVNGHLALHSDLLEKSYHLGH